MAEMYVETVDDAYPLEERYAMNNDKLEMETGRLKLTLLDAQNSRKSDQARW
jgi:hypothetical protein